MPRTVVVIGGGVAGLVAARDLAGVGDHVVLLESDARVGGAVRSEALAGVAVDVGAEAYGVARPETRALIDELGLSDSVTAPRRAEAHLLHDDGLHALPHALMGVPTDLADARVVSLLGTDAAGRAARLDAAPVVPVPPDATLGGLVRERMGDAVVERILTPVVAGVHAAHPDLVEVDAVVPGLRSALDATGSLAAAAARLRAASGVPGSAVAGLAGGMGTLVAALEQDCRHRGVEVRTGAAVADVRPTGSGWTVTAGGAALAADAVVLAVDAGTGARVLAAVPDVAGALAGISLGDVVVCAAVLDAPALDDDPVGSGLLIAPGHPRVRAKAMTHATAKWGWLRAAYGPGRHLVRLSYGRDGRVDEPTGDLPDLVRADLAAILGIDPPDLVDLNVARWDRSLVLPRPGHRAAVARVRAAEGAHPGLAVAGAGLGGNGLAGTIAEARAAAARVAEARVAEARNDAHMPDPDPDGRLTS